MERCKQCHRSVQPGSKHCEKHKARRGLHRVKFVEGVKNRVRTEHGHLVCENLTDCPLYGLVEYKENWLDADHIIEVMEFDDSATLKEINDPRTNGRLQREESFITSRIPSMEF